MIEQLIALYGDNYHLVEKDGVQTVTFKNEQGIIQYRGVFYPESVETKHERFLKNFHFQHDFRKTANGDEHVWLVQYKGVTLAIFHGYDSTERAKEWCFQHGPLAEWMYQKISTKRYQNWSAAMEI